MSRALTAALAASALLLLGVGPASAATIEVPFTQDVQNNSFDDPGCTLRDAIQAANTNVDDQTGAKNGCKGDNAGADTIILKSGSVYTLNEHGVDDSNAKGDLDIKGPVTIRSSGPGLATIDGLSNTSPGLPEGGDRVIHALPTAGAVTLEGLEIEGGHPVIPKDPTPLLAFNGGGGILNETQMTIRNSEIVANAITGEGSMLGGGIYNRSSTSKLTMTGSTVSDNDVLGEVGGGGAIVGGGIASYEASTALTIANSTISGNSIHGKFAKAGSIGGVFAGDYLNFPTIDFNHVTIVDNKAEVTGGMQIVAGTVTGLIAAGNVQTLFPGTSGDCYEGGEVKSGGGNLIGEVNEGETDCVFQEPGDLFGKFKAPINANLGTLVDNGGPTRTRVPNPGSPALNRGGPCPEKDQRGLFRAPGGACDAGAVEVGATATPPATPVTPAPPVTLTPPPAPPAPSASLAVARKAKVAGGGRLTVSTGIDATCPAGVTACASNLAITRALKPKTSLGKAVLSVPTGTTQEIKLKLTRGASNQLRNAGKLKVTISVDVSTPGGTPALATRTVKLTSP